MVALNLSDSQISAQSAGRSVPLSEPGALTEATALLQTLILHAAQKVSPRAQSPSWLRPPRAELQSRSMQGRSAIRLT